MINKNINSFTPKSLRIENPYTLGKHWCPAKFSDLSLQKAKEEEAKDAVCVCLASFLRHIFLTSLLANPFALLGRHRTASVQFSNSSTKEKGLQKKLKHKKMPPFSLLSTMMWHLLCQRGRVMDVKSERRYINLHNRGKHF